MNAINLKKINPTISFKTCQRENKGSESNGCLMRLTPFAVWAKNLNKEDLFLAVKLQTMMTHASEIAIEASYLYCYAIGLLINGTNA